MCQASPPHTASTEELAEETKQWLTLNVRKVADVLVLLSRKYGKCHSLQQSGSSQYFLEGKYDMGTHITLSLLQFSLLPLFSLLLPYTSPPPSQVAGHWDTRQWELVSCVKSPTAQDVFQPIPVGLEVVGDGDGHFMHTHTCSSEEKMLMTPGAEEYPTRPSRSRNVTLSWVIKLSTITFHLQTVKSSIVKNTELS